MLDGSIYPWALLGIVVVAALVADVLLFHRESHEVTLREAAIETTGWIGLSLVFAAWIYHSRGQEPGLQFLTAYLVEKSLSADNILIFLLIFASLGVPAKSQHRVLFYGVAGALLMRALFILAGIELLQKFHLVLFLFGALLLVTAVRMLLRGSPGMRPERNRFVRFLCHVLPVADHYEGDDFWVNDDGKRKATALLLALLVIEVMDIVFAVDSVPAVLAITRDPFIAYSSNAFAVLGLRALYFTLAGALARLRYLHQGLAVILLFVAAKMLAGDRLHVSTGISLGVVGGILLLTVLASIAPGGRKK